MKLDTNFKPGSNLVDYSSPKSAQGRTWERADSSFQFSEDRCVPTAMWDTLAFPRLPHRASRQTYRRPIHFFWRADGQM